MADESPLPSSFDLVADSSKKHHIELLGQVEVMLQTFRQETPATAKETANSIVARAHT